ncbi:MAG: N-acetyl-gamma-glutamyl-phosphate reductase [Candidatus Omnitrophica bacterium]|nr:N-acetyl-gamma-glutamyl-phosphate reductase [Candidatus Omnitrophota bacterium]
MLNCAILGARSHTGIELIKILLRHPHVRLSHLVTGQKQALPLTQVLGTLPKDVNLEIRPFRFAEIQKKADLIFLCLPHTESMEKAAAFRKAGKIVIDLSADFRLNSWRVYESWYGVKHGQKELLKEAVYGLSELFRSKIEKSDLIANPGCYPTGAILGIAPLLKRHLIDEGSLVIDAKSGVSGAGKKLKPETQFCEVDENFYAYKVGRHQHTPEIEQALSEVAGEEIEVSFVPHLLPIERGILSTIYLQKKKSVKTEDLQKAYLEDYGQEPFVRLKAPGTYPSLKDVQRTNFCDIGLFCDEERGQVIVITAIDNLIKGASGQAVQNMNIRCGFQEEEGLRTW